MTIARGCGILIYDLVAFVVGLLIFNPITIAILNLVATEWLDDVEVDVDELWLLPPWQMSICVMRWLCKLLWVAGATVVLALLLAIDFIVFNPFVVWCISFIAPKWAAKKKRWFLPASLNRWVMRLTPWYARKHYVNERWQRASSKDRIRFCLEEDDQNFFSLSDSEKKIAFCHASRAQRRKWVEGGVEMTSPAMFLSIVNDGVDEVVKYAKRHNNQLTEDELGRILSFGAENAAAVIGKLTLSDEQLLMLAKSQRQFNNLLAALSRQGCGKGVVSYIMNAVKEHVGGDAERQVRSALTEWRQKGQVTLLRDDADGFEALCKSGQLCPAAQVKMSVEQYRIYHECGWKLAEEAIRCFLLNGSEELVKTIFELEEKNGITSQRTADIVYSSPELSNVLLKVKAANKAAEAEKEWVY